VNTTNGVVERWTVPNKKRLLLVALFVALLGGLGWLLLPPPDLLFHDKPESVWINNLKYNDSEQEKEWRTYGEEGVRVLIRGLERANRPGERVYRRFYSNTPRFIARWLPAPRADSTRGTRQLVCALLSSLGKEARIAVPAMARALNDEDEQVRQFAIIFFGWPWNADSVLSLMDEKEKSKILPDLIRVMQDGEGPGINGLAALKYFCKQKDVVVPILVTALQDANSQIRILAAEALNRVEPNAAKKAGAASVVIKILKDPNDPQASFAVTTLRHFKNQPEVAVPVLIECLQSTNSSIACEAVWILEWSRKEFKNYADTIVPALKKAAQRKDYVGSYAKVAFQRFQFEGGPTQAPISK